MPNLTYILLLLIAASLVLHILSLLQRKGRAALGFAALLGLNLGLTLSGLVLSRPMPWAFFAAALFVVIVLVPGLLGAWMRLAIHRGNYPVALRLLDWRAHLQPGLRLHRERETLASLALVNEGRGGEAIETVTQQLAANELPPHARRMMVERALTMLLLEERLEEARQLFDREGGIALAGESPSICLTMVRVFGELGEIDELARCQLMMETGPLAEDPQLGQTLNASRIACLAHLGCVDELSPLLEEDAHIMPGATEQRRQLWLGVALWRAGEVGQARSIWQRLVAAEEEDPRAAEGARRMLRKAELPPLPAPLSPETRELIALVVSRALVNRAAPRATARPWELAPVTVVLLVAIVAIHVALALSSGGTLDAMELLRWGANFRQLSLGSETWRLLASAFLHVDWFHLALNGYALFLLGRFVEQLFGSAIFLAIYGAAAVGGAWVSAIVGQGLLSVGASGAIFGLLGAALVGLRALRGRVPDGWRRQIRTNLLVVIALQIFVGLRFDAIDNAAHFGGLAFGGLVAALLALPHGALAMRLKRIGVAILGAAILTFSGWTVLQLSLSKTRDPLSRVPTTVVKRLGVSFRYPAHWRFVEGGKGLALRDPLSSLATTLVLLPPLGTDAAGSLEKACAEGNAAILGAIRQQREVNDVELVEKMPQRVGANLLRSEVRIEVGDHTVYQTHYFKRQGTTLLTLIGRADSRHRESYRRVFDRLASSIRWNGIQGH